MTYLYAATTNVCLNVLRARGFREPDDASALAPSGPSGLGAIEARNLILALSKVLDERAMHIAVLQFIDGLPQEEIARLLDLSRKTIGRETERIRQLAGALAGVRAEDT